MLNKIDKMSKAPKRFKISKNPLNLRSKVALLSDLQLGKIFFRVYLKKVFALNFER